jgi:hypothetical protein
MIAEEKVVSLGSLRDEILELKRAVAELRAMVQAKPELDHSAAVVSQPSISFEDASEHVRSNYSHLLQKLSQ